jgi:hypothetical protein
MPKAIPIVDDYAAIAAATRQTGPAVETDDAPNDVELLALCEEFRILYARLNKADELDDAAFTALHKERMAILDDIEELVATTPAGLRAKAGVAILLIEENPEGRLDRGVAVALSVLEDIADLDT